MGLKAEGVLPQLFISNYGTLATFAKSSGVMNE
jgi:hypothetical protein